MKRIAAIVVVGIIEMVLVGSAAAQQPGLSVHAGYARSFARANVPKADASYAERPHALPLNVENTFIVTTANDSGTGSLKWAIVQANNSPGLDEISFSIGTGPQTIHVQGNLPFITDPVILDATTQPGYSGKPIIELDGTNSNDYGLRVQAGPSTIRGLVVNGFPLGGIVVGSVQFSRNDSITVENCYVGTDLTGTQAKPNGGGSNSSPDEGGIIVFFSGADIIGSKVAGKGNVVSGNNGPGITITGNGANGTLVYGNYAGTNASASSALPNQGAGIELDGNTNFQTIGDTAAPNIVSGNSGDGILLWHCTTGPNRIRGNRIGTSANGKAAVSNGEAGIFVNQSNNNTIGGPDSVYGNTISGNSYGIRIDSGSTGSIIEANKIGTDNTGILDLGNTVAILVKDSPNNTIGGTTVGMGNSIAFNGDGIVVLDSGGIQIRRNSIFSNKSEGIMLGSKFVPNDSGDADVGPNNLQNYPILDSTSVSGTNTTIYGKLNSMPNSSYAIEFFADSECHPDATHDTRLPFDFAEGREYLGSRIVTTDSKGNALIVATVPTTPRSARYITATATDNANNTSMFGPCLALADSDGDGIPDLWERQGGGIDINGDGVSDYDLYGQGARVDHKDMFVEVDAMQGRAPNPQALAMVTASFANVSNALVNNPDGKNGINLHAQLDDVTLPFASWNWDFDANGQPWDTLGPGYQFYDLKRAWFGTQQERTASNSSLILLAKRQVFRYCIFADDYDPTNNNHSSGIAELPGADFLVTLGQWPLPGGTLNQQAGTFMHEMGHTLGLRHGGGDDLQWKPNYYSVMNYMWQRILPGVTTAQSWSLNYSVQALPSLNQNALNENAGLNPLPGVFPNIWVPFRRLGNNPIQYARLAPNRWVDWNGNGINDPGTVASDIDHLGGNGSELEPDPSPNEETLNGYADWPNLIYSFRKTSGFARGAPDTSTNRSELTELSLAMANTLDSLIALYPPPPDTESGIEQSAESNHLVVTVAPNPFRERTAFDFTLSVPALVTLAIVDPLGRPVATIVDQMLPPGPAHYDWHAESLPRGIYFYRFEASVGASSEHRTGKLVLVE